MYGLFVTIIVIASVLLTIAVLLQNSKGGGLASNFAAGNQTFGVRQAADILEKFGIDYDMRIISAHREHKMDITKDLQQSAPANAAPTFPITTGQSETPAEETPAQQ